MRCTDFIIKLLEDYNSLSTSYLQPYQIASTPSFSGSNHQEIESSGSAPKLDVPVEKVYRYDQDTLQGRSNGKAQGKASAPSSSFLPSKSKTYKHKKFKIKFHVPEVSNNNKMSVIPKGIIKNLRAP